MVVGHCGDRHACFRPNMPTRILVPVMLDKLLSETPAARAMPDRLLVRLGRESGGARPGKPIRAASVTSPIATLQSSAPSQRVAAPEDVQDVRESSAWRLGGNK